MTESQHLLEDLLRIPSPTYGEKAKTDFLVSWITKMIPQIQLDRVGNNIIGTYNPHHKKIIGFVGHTDTVPAFFTPYKRDDRLYGSGASDMQAGLASFLSFIRINIDELTSRHGIQIILYDKEEGTSLKENGLNELIQERKSYLEQMDLAIVAEPTNNTIQLGCVGSIHHTVNIHGKAAHSARPWNGENALYKSIPLIQRIASLEPLKQTVFGVDFYDVIDITQSQSTPGRTTVPEWWEANINYRFSPNHSLEEAIKYVETVVNSTRIEGLELSMLDAVPAGNVIPHSILDKAKELLDIEAKQAWTDVAQLTSLGICAFNFGPGRQDQAHLPNECVNLNDMVSYEKYLAQLLLTN